MLSQVIYCIEDRLTRFPLLDPFGHQREGGEQFDEYLCIHLSHSDRKRDLGIDVEVFQKVFDRVEKIDQCIISVNGVLDRLISLDVRKICTWGLNRGPYRD